MDGHWAALLGYAATDRTGTSRGRPAARLIAGLIPEATSPMTDEMRRALDECKQLIEDRADALTEAAVAQPEPWVRHLGAPPDDPQRRRAWIRHARIVAAYRDRYHVTASGPLGLAAKSTAQLVDAARARAALLRAQQLATADAGSEARSMPRRRAGTSL